MFQNKIISGLLAMAAFMPQSKEVQAETQLCSPMVRLEAPSANRTCRIVNRRIQDLYQLMGDDFNTALLPAGAEPYAVPLLDVKHFPSRESLSSEYPQHARGKMLHSPVDSTIYSYENHISNRFYRPGYLLQFMIHSQTYHNLFHELSHFIVTELTPDYKRSHSWLEDTGFVPESFIEGLAEMYVWSIPFKEIPSYHLGYDVHYSLMRYPINYGMYLRFQGQKCPSAYDIFFNSDLPRSDFNNYFCSSLYLRFLKSQRPTLFVVLLQAFREPKTGYIYSFAMNFANQELQKDAQEFIDLLRGGMGGQFLSVIKSHSFYFDHYESGAILWVR